MFENRNVPHATPDRVKEFLYGYADALKGFELPESDFPLSSNVVMSAGCVVIKTRDGRHVASVSVNGDIASPAMPLGPATLQYAKLFVDLANAWYESHKVQAAGSAPQAVSRSAEPKYDPAKDPMFVEEGGVRIEPGYGGE